MACVCTCVPCSVKRFDSTKRNPCICTHHTSGGATEKPSGGGAAVTAAAATDCAHANRPVSALPPPWPAAPVPGAGHRASSRAKTHAWAPLHAVAGQPPVCAEAREAVVRRRRGSGRGLHSDMRDASANERVRAAAARTCFLAQGQQIFIRRTNIGRLPSESGRPLLLSDDSDGVRAHSVGSVASVAVCV